MHRGDIYWHALPFNGQLEFFDVSLLEFAVQLTHEIDVRFGLPPKRTMSQVMLTMKPPASHGVYLVPALMHGLIPGLIRNCQMSVHRLCA